MKFDLLAILSILASGSTVRAADDGGLGYELFPTPKEDDESSDRFIICPSNERGMAIAMKKATKVHSDLKSVGCIAVSMNPRAASALADNKNIDYIETDPKRYMLDDMPSRLRGSIKGVSTSSAKNRRLIGETTPYGISLTQAEDLTYNSTSNMKVCIMDGGYDTEHEDLQRSQVDGSGTEFAGDDWDKDSRGHGTHVAGTIAALDNDKGVVGIVSDGKMNLHIVKLCNDDGYCGYSSDIIHGIETCKYEGAKVVNMSFGGSSKSRTEERAFQLAYDEGVLSIAAAGNSGIGPKSYPASYDSVISVAAVDASKNIADFSSQNRNVEIAAPGVNVYSTIPMGTETELVLSVDQADITAYPMNGSPSSDVSGKLFRCDLEDGLGSPGDCVGATGQVCLIKRGLISFAEKVLECQNQGGTGAIVFNNEAGIVYATLGDVATTIPSVTVSDTDGAYLEDQEGEQVESDTVAVNYSYKSGTSMASPHVTGIAALIWSRHTGCSAHHIREALITTAEDLGRSGWDKEYGYGLVQAKDADDALDC